MSIVIKRIYEQAEQDDGKRILVDRLWPRGVSKERAHLDEWLKEVTPSSEARIWFGHKAERFDEFKQRYEQELETDPEKQKAVDHLRELSAEGKVTLLYAAKSETINHAIILKDYLEALLS